MQESAFILRNKVGLHARPAALFVRTAAKFKSRITVSKNDRTADAKSILSVLSLGAEKGDCIVIRTEGEDEVEAMEALKALIENNFGEEDS
ncbi:MAG: HPr family phosphocarrier protein [Candidatus Bathyarchaeia archaeon]